MANVPNVPGVPALSGYSTSGIILATADTAFTVAHALTPQWGIYYQGIPVIASSIASQLGLGAIVSSLNAISQAFGITVDSQFSAVDFEYKQDWTVADYPVEQGGFQSYDKVQHPFDVRMRMAAGGSEANRQALLNIVEDSANSLNLYDVVTPEQTYSSCNITHYDYRRTATNGVGLIVIDLWLIEIRVTSTAAFTTTQQPGVAGQQGNGAVNTMSPSAVVQQDFSNFD